MINTFSMIDLDNFSPGNPLTINLTHFDGSSETIKCKHTYNKAQIEWFRAGSAINLIRSQQ